MLHSMTTAIRKITATEATVAKPRMTAEEDNKAERTGQSVLCKGREKKDAYQPGPEK